MSNKQRKAAAALAGPKPENPWKYVRAADEDDDRKNNLGPVNPRYDALNATRRGWGWHPPINIRLATMKEEYPHVTDYDWRGTAGFFHAILYPGTYGGRWRIACIGGDDYSVCKIFENEKKARAMWDKLNHHITLRTLRRLGFVTD